MIPFKGIWKDLGTWNTLAEELGSDQGLVIKGEGTANTQIINELDIPMLVLGAKNMVIAASPDGILVTGKNESSFMKPYVEKFQYRPMFEERRWGTYKVLNYTTYGDENKSLTKHLFICKGKNISYQTHTYRDEIWTIVDGEGILILEDEARKVSRGDVISIEAGMKHAIKAITDLTIVEVQIGSELAEQDIKRYEYEWKE
jgi:mannose-1-phosphate guanylyltransferase